MSNKTKKYTRYFGNNMRLDLTYNGLISQCEIYNIIEEIKNTAEKDQIKMTDPVLQFIENYKNIESILSKTDINIFEYLYLNRIQIHKILYIDDENIPITSQMMNNFSDYYYLYFLIRDEETLNYKYEFELISKLHEKLIASKSSIQKIIYAKILLCFIKNYLEIGEGECDDKCNEIEGKCRKLINSEKDSLKNFNINLNLDKLDEDDIGIDDIYTNIIISLIKMDKLNDSQETVNILTELDIKNLRINKKIFTNLETFLNKDNLKQYIITKYDDLLNKNIIIFYRMLFVYILKSSDYIYYIPYLSEVREKIIGLIKSNIHNFNNDLKKNKNEENIIKLKEVLSYFIEQDYYIEQSKLAQIEKIIKSNNPSGKSNAFSNKYQSNNSIMKSTSSNYSNNNSSTNNPFNIFYNEIGDQVHLSSAGNYIQNEQERNEIKSEQAYQILCNSTFNLVVKYQKGQNMANINYTSITYGGDENQESALNLDINDIKMINSQNETLNINYEKFLQFLDKIEKELKSGFRLEKESHIKIKFFLKSSDIENNTNYNLECNYYIKDESIGESSFTDEDFLNTTNHTGLSYLINSLESS